MHWLEIGNIALGAMLLIQMVILMWVVNRLVTLGLALKAMWNRISADSSDELTTSSPEATGG